MPISQEQMQDINNRVIEKAKNDKDFQKRLSESPWDAVKECCSDSLKEEDLKTLVAGLAQFLENVNLDIKNYNN